MITPPVTIMTHGIVAAAAGAWVWQANSYEAIVRPITRQGKCEDISTDTVVLGTT